MRVILDTAVFLWAFFGDEKSLSRKAKDVYADPENALYLSAASLWEIAIKYSLKKLSLKAPPHKLFPPMLEKMGISPLPIYAEQALATDSLPFHHKDPFDRLLVAQSKIENIPILSPDRFLKKYKAEILW